MQKLLLPRVLLLRVRLLYCVCFSAFVLRAFELSIGIFLLPMYYSFGMLVRMFQFQLQSPSGARRVIHVRIILFVFLYMSLSLYNIHDQEKQLFQSSEYLAQLGQHSACMHGRVGKGWVRADGSRVQARVWLLIFFTQLHSLPNLERCLNVC